jgi:hypothetical protein
MIKFAGIALGGIIAVAGLVHSEPAAAGPAFVVGVAPPVVVVGPRPIAYYGAPYYVYERAPYFHRGYDRDYWRDRHWHHEWRGRDWDRR